MRPPLKRATQNPSRTYVRNGVVYIIRKIIIENFQDVGYWCIWISAICGPVWMTTDYYCNCPHSYTNTALSKSRNAGSTTILQYIYKFEYFSSIFKSRNPNTVMVMIGPPCCGNSNGGLSLEPIILFSELILWKYFCAAPFKTTLPFLWRLKLTRPSSHGQLIKFQLPR